MILWGRDRLLTISVLLPISDENFELSPEIIPLKSSSKYIRVWRGDEKKIPSLSGMKGGVALVLKGMGIILNQVVHFIVTHPF